MNIVIGTTRTPKVNAVVTASEEILKKINKEYAQLCFFSLEVESNISGMPLTQSELMEGARNRARNAWEKSLERHIAPDFSVGLEGGFFKGATISSTYFLQSWVYIQNDKTGYYGASGAIEVPEIIVHEVVELGQELGEIIDKYGDEEDIRSKGGAFETFSKGVLNRQQSFELAFACAFLPFFNDVLYS